MNINERIVFGKEKLDYNIIFVTGSSRVGKTLFSKSVSCCENVEWIEEPFHLSLLLKLAGLGYLDKSLFRMMFSSVLHELINDCILLRNANFRANDLSGIWNFKTPKNIFERLNNINTRVDVMNYIEDKKPYFLIDMPDVLPFLSIATEMCNNSSVVNVVRHPCDVADSCKLKGWFKEEYINNSANIITRCYRGHKIPWWVKVGFEEHFLTLPLWDRGLMYWEMIYGYGEHAEGNLLCYDHIIRYEDLISNPENEINNFISKYNLSKTSLLSARIEEIGLFLDTPSIDRQKSDYIKKNDKIKILMRCFGYEF